MGLRSHLIDQHAVDWSNDALLNRDQDAMRRMHDEDHDALDRGEEVDLVRIHDRTNFGVMNTRIVAKSNRKEQQWKQMVEHERP